MRLESRLEDVGNRRVEFIFLTHGEEEIKWQMLERTRREDGLDLFAQINAFWMEQPAQWQDQAFGVYQRIRDILVESPDVYALMRSLLAPIAELLDMHDLDALREFVDMRAGIIVPSSVPDEYLEEDGSRKTRTKTYTREDYLSFATLSVALRPALPVWGEFIFLTKQEVDVHWKEYFAFQLVSMAKLMESHAMLRLQSYVLSMLPSEEEMQAVSLSHGISSQDYPEWITSVLVVRRLAIVDLRGLGGTNAIAYIFSYLTNRTRNWNNSLMGGIQPKRKPENYGAEGESKLSHFEEYKIKQKTSAGDIVTIEHELSMPVRVAKAICPDLDLSLLEQSRESVKALETKEILDSQRALASFVTARWIPARAVELFQKLSLLEEIAIVQAVLWQRGFYDLAALVSAAVLDNSMERRPGIYGKQPPVPKEILDELDRLYPYHRRISQKSKTQKEKNNTVLRIEQIADELKEQDWTLTLPQAWQSQVAANIHGRRYVAPPDLKITLMQLVIKIGSRTL